MQENDGENNEGRPQSQQNPRLTGKSWISASASVTITLPKHLAEKHNLTEPCTIIFEDSERGIVIRRFNPRLH